MSKSQFICESCGTTSPKWIGCCPDCGTWNSYVETAIANPKSVRHKGLTGEINNTVKSILDVNVIENQRTSSGLSELDRVLGGGLVPGSVVLMGGDPGIGKSTVLLQAISHLSQHMPVLYITGEESLQQVSARAHRLGLARKEIRLLAQTHIETILDIIAKEQPKVVVIDSIQTVFTDTINSAPGSVSQVRESAAKLTHYAKQTNTTLFLVGHVTKEGALAGPRVLEHMVDTVLYFEGERDNRFRIVRAVKNRFGAVNELGIFAMSDKGLREVTNPCSIFLSRYEKPVSGSSILVTWEGTRPMLVEIQALVDNSHLGNPRRVSVGLDPNRLTMLLAILSRHGGIVTGDQDVFVNAVGGVRVLETGSDLSVLLSVLSSLKNQALPADLVVFGEVGLAGEIRPVQGGQERLQEAAKHGFKRAIVPKANMKKTEFAGMQITPVQNLTEVLENI
ncbi:MAG: DNA repair protein RadA [Gammaproteobacteria bacterium]|jgi:DNA repair protein RadA/Sms